MTRRAGPDDDASSGPTQTSAEPAAEPSLDDGRFPPGTVLAGRYRIVALLGRGGMGEVYRADDLRLREPVALKMLPPGLAADAGRLARFHAEVRLARQVTHPNVCRVHDIGEANGLTFLTMEHVDGEDLASLLRRIGRLPAERAAIVGRQICAGLAAAHEQGVVHRDLKPANIMIDGRGRARLTDFGLAVAAGDPRAARESAGTPAYMAPEQWDGRSITERTDLYSLGLVLYEMFTGQRAFAAPATPPSADRAATLPRPTSLVPGLDSGIERVILQCLESDPARRPASAAAVAAALAGPDPLAAVVAAGETPSPEMVAAAGEGTALHPGVAIALAGATIAVQLLGFVLLDRTALVNRIPLDRPPEALAERAREMLDRVVGLHGPQEQAFGFAHDRRSLDWIQEHDASPSRWDRLAKGRPSPLQFWYRQSPRRMAPYNDALLVRPQDPPLEPGMALVRLDPQGRLLELLAPAGTVLPSGSGAPDWTALLVEAGLDPAALRPSATTWVPPVFADAVAAFDGAFPEDPAVPLRVEMAAYHGRPVAFRLRGPWDEGRPAPARTIASVAAAATTVMLVPVLGVAVLLARRNHRLGRSDRRGAFRIAAFAFACDLLYALLRYGRPSSAMGVWLLFSRSAGGALFDAAAAWVLYLALEPHVRRRWPQALVSWSRLLSGRFNDPLVGRDILFGVSAAAASAALAGLGLEAPRWHGQTPPPFLLDAYLGFLAGAHRFIAWVSGFMAVTATLLSLTCVLLVVLLAAVLRGRGRAGVALWVIWTGLTISSLRVLAYGRPSLDQYVLFALINLVTVLVVARWGLLAFAVYVVTQGCLLECPAVLRLPAWYAVPSAWSFLFVLGVLAWGLYASLSARPLRWEGVLEEG